MKNFFIMAAVACVLSACGPKAEETAEATEGFKPSQERQDSITYSMARMRGAQFVTYYYNNLLKEDSTLNREQMLKGIQFAMNYNMPDRSFMMGVMMGLEMRATNEMYADKYDVNVDKDTFMKHFRVIATADSISGEQAMMLNQEYENQMMQMINERNAYDLAIADAEATKFVDSIAASGVKLVKLPSGASVDVKTAGTGREIQPETQILVKMQPYFVKDGKLVNQGKAFEQMVTPDKLSVAMQQALVGQQEGVEMRLYAPGKSEGRVKSNPEIGLRAGEIIVYDINVLPLPVNE